jgi:hypothetical protein
VIAVGPFHWHPDGSFGGTRCYINLRMRIFIPLLKKILVGDRREIEMATEPINVALNGR